MARTLTLPTPRRVGHLTGWDTLVAPGVLQQKDGSFLACLRFQGLDLRHALDTASVVQALRLNALLRRLGAGWGLMTEVHRHPCTSYPTQTFPEPVSRCLDQERQTWWRTPGHLYTTTTTLTLTYRRPPLALPGWKRFLFAHLPQQDLDAETLAWFTQEVARFLGLFRGCCATADWLQETDLLTYLKGTISFQTQQVAVPDLPIYLDTYLSDTDLTQERQWPSLLRWPQLGDQWLRCVGIKGYPQETSPGILDALADLPLAYRATCRYIPLAHGQAVQKLTRVRHAHYGLRKSVWSMALAHAGVEDSPLDDHAALAFEEEAAEHQAGVRRGQFSYGYVTQTVVVWDDTFEGATAKAAQVADVINRADFVAKVETLNTLDAWVGTLPGQMVANVRQPLLHSHNLAHLLPLHAPWPGPSWNRHLGGPPLLQTVGSGQTPFALDTYDGDVGMAYIAGPIGCHAPGTKILMANGMMKPVEVLRVGDQVMGPDSRPRTITALHHGTSQMVRVHPTKGESFDVNLDHVLALKRTQTGTSLDGKIVTLTVREWLRKSATFQNTHKLFRAGVDFPPAAPLPLHPYIVGVLLGDGSLTSPPSVTNPDPAIRERVEKLANEAGLQVCDLVGNHVCPKYSIKDQPWVRSFRGKSPLRLILESLGLYGHTAASKRIPLPYKTASRDDRLALLAGLLDTDGSLSTGCYDYISLSPLLASDLCFLARSLGLAAYCTQVTKHCQTMEGQYWRVSISGDASGIPCMVPRKQASPRQQKKSVLVTGLTVEPLGVGDYYGFACDGDHLYLLDDFTVVHNSGKSTLLATMVSQWLKYPGAQVRIFDTGQSLRCMTYALGGHWYDVAAQLEGAGQQAQHLDDPTAQFWGSPWIPQDQPWQCFELEGLLRTPALIETVIAPLMQVLKDRLTGAPTMFVFDEGHLYLLHRAFAKGIDDYLRGLRKKNANVIFATQSIADAARSDLAPIISDSAMTRIYLPNYHALEPETAKIYQGWGLNERQCALLASLVPKQDYYYQGREGHRVFQLALGPMALAFAGASRKPELALMDTLYHGASVPFAIEWLHARGCHVQADYLKSEGDL